MDPTNQKLCVIGVFLPGVMKLWCTFLKKTFWLCGCSQRSRMALWSPLPPFLSTKKAKKQGQSLDEHYWVLIFSICRISPKYSGYVLGKYSFFTDKRSETICQLFDEKVKTYKINTRNRFQAKTLILKWYWYWKSEKKAKIWIFWAIDQRDREKVIPRWSASWEM